VATVDDTRHVVRGEDAGSVDIGHIGATEDEASRRVAHVRRPGSLPGEASQPAQAAGARAYSRLDRAVAALPLVSAWLLVFVLFAWHASAHPSPWLFSDEAEYTQLSRSIAEGGDALRRGEDRDFSSLYTVVLAPVWFIEDTETAYEVAKQVGVLLMTLAFFPAYWLARTLVPRGWALFAAVGTVSIPAMAYSRLLISEPLAYPVATLTLFLLVKALATWRREWLAGALLALVVAPFVRSELQVLRAAAVLAVLVVLWLGEPGRRLRARWGLWEWVGVATLGLLALMIGNELAKRVSGEYDSAAAVDERMVDFGLWSAGALTIGLGVLPVVAALVALWRPDEARSSPAYRAFAAVFVASIAGFVLYTATKAAYLSTVFGNIISERNLIYLAPLVFTAAALFFHRSQANPLVLAGATALVAWMIVETPFNLDHYPYADAPGLAILAEANRTLSLDDPSIERRLLWLLAGSAGLLLVAAYVRRRAPAAVSAGLAVVAAGVIAWNVTGALSFGDGINHFSERLAQSVPEPPNWIDAHTGGAPTVYVGQGIADSNPVLLTEFWNRSIDHVASLDTTAPGPGPAPTLVPYRPDGTVFHSPDVEYLVTDSGGVDVFGREVTRTGLWRLIRLDGPVRLRSSLTGVFPDGWTGPSASYSRFGTGTSGTLEVLVSRVGWGGRDRPGDVTVRVGELVPTPAAVIDNPCSGSVCRSTQPTIGRVYGVDRWEAHAKEQKLLRFEVTTPFRVEIAVSPTFSPAEFGEGDGRQLGVQVAFAFKPSA